ncbi:MAG: hypothetical protein HXY34_09920 [Candidatus Thorarchaeota archaeon]|nr:hypothetical protein [Candidatus Thorarchaeota archaeon]
MNQLSHMIFAFSFFVALYTGIYAFTVWFENLSVDVLILYYLGGGLLLAVVATPILYYKAPNKSMGDRTTTNAASGAALLFITFFIGGLGGCVIHQWIYDVHIAGNMSIFVGSISVLVGALMPDWDIPFLGIERHRNIVFHSFLLPVIVLLPTLGRILMMIVFSTVGQLVNYIEPTELYILGFFMLGYASHLALDVLPSKANPWEILWRVVSPLDEAPVGLKTFGPFKVPKKRAKGWLVGNAAFLALIGFGLIGLYYYYFLVVLP